jgi:CO/xanthine dehydrogenase Mo-binding subunit
VRTQEILDKLESHAIWQQRAQEKERGRERGVLVGTGVACVTKDYGTGADTSLARIEIDPDGASPFGAITSRRSPTGSPAIWAPWPMRSQSRAVTASARSRW